MSEKRYRVSSLIIEKSGALEKYKETVIGCILYDSKTYKNYRLDGEIAEYLLKRKCSLLDTKEVKLAIKNYSISKIDESQCQRMYGNICNKTDDIEYSELDKIAEKSEPIWSWVGQLTVLDYMNLVTVIYWLPVIFTLLYTIVQI